MKHQVGTLQSVVTLLTELEWNDWLCFPKARGQASVPCVVLPSRSEDAVEMRVEGRAIQFIKALQVGDVRAIIRNGTSQVGEPLSTEQAVAGILYYL